MPSAITDWLDDQDDVSVYDVEIDKSYSSSKSSDKMSSSRMEGLRVPSPAFVRGIPSDDMASSMREGMRTPSPAFVRADAESHVNLEEQIIELHCLVQEMKEGFVLAMQELSRIQNGDRLLQETLEKHKSDSDARVEQLTKMVETLQSDLGKAVDDVSKNSETTADLKRQMDELREQQNDIKNKMAEKTDRANVPNSQSQSRSNRSSQSDESGFHRDVFDDPKDSVPPMLQPFIDSLPEAGEKTVDPEHSDSDDSTIQAADQMMKLSRKFAQEYHRHRARLASPSTDNLLFNRNLGQNEQNSERTIMSSDSDKSKRRRVVDSLVSSERIYVSNLRFIQECIIQPLVIESIIPLNDINVMFPPCFGELYHEHSAFLDALETRLSDWKWKGIVGDVLARLSGGDESNLLKIYTLYVKMFRDGLSMLANHLGTSKNFYQFIEKQLDENGKGKIDPITYLMAPLQRISYYVHSMKRLLKYTAKNHPDRFHVESCLKQLNGFVNEINRLTSQNLPSPTTREPQRERRNSKASFSSMSSMETNLRDSGVHSMEGERGMANISPTEIKDMWANRQSSSKMRPKGRRKSVTSEAINLAEHNDRGGPVTMSFPPSHANRESSSYNGVHLSGNAHLVTQYPENSVVPVPGMLGKGINASNFQGHDNRQPGDVIDTTRKRRKDRARRMSLSRMQSFGVYGEEEDTDLEHMGYVPSTPANAMPRTLKQNGNSRMRQHRKSIDGMVVGLGHHRISDSLLAAHHALLEGHSNLKRMQYRSSDNVPSVAMESDPHFISLADLRRHQFSERMDEPRPLPQHLRTGTQNRLYARRKSIDVGALQAHIIREEQLSELQRPRSRKTSHSPRSHSPKAPSPTRRTAVPSRSHHRGETQEKNSNGLSEREADAITQQVFVRTCNVPEEDSKDPRQKKQGHFKLKNIFKRRGPGSRVMELTDNNNKPSSNNNYLNPEPEERRRTPSPRPSNRTKNTPQYSKPIDLESYVDEDGEPCSAV
nr:uncharacterized protein LOC129264824 [Lytechinus pictus]XP_054758747.1 uncharacterized protein LOC129264824 [Lytechinus pictus]